MQTRTKYPKIFYKPMARNCARGIPELFDGYHNIFRVADYRNGGPFADPAHIHFYMDDVMHGERGWTFFARADVFELYNVLVDYILSNKTQIIRSITNGKNKRKAKSTIKDILDGYKRYYG